MKVVAVLSMLHEGAGETNSATRRFRSEAPLGWALYRLGKAKRLGECVILCWQDQSEAVAPIASEMKCRAHSPSARTAIPHLDAISAARRWADGWRGGLFQTCEFDRGFHAGWVREILESSQADAVLLVDPSAGLVDPDLIDSLIEHAGNNPETDLCFSQAAPGLNGVLLRRPLVEQLATGGSHPGTLLVYRPDLPMRDPISMPSCAPIPTPLARTCHRFTLDSTRQIARIAGATTHLNGELPSTEAEQLLHLLDAAPEACEFPREIVVELTVKRIAKPIFAPGTHVKIEREDLSLERAKKLFREFAAVDDARIVFAGAGDPILHPQFEQIVASAADAGISAIAIETDLLQIDAAALERLAALPIDIVSIIFPAITAKTYFAMMGIDGLKTAMENLARLVHFREARARGTPLVVPTFVKTATNLAEMEGWYDHWLRTLGCAVIAGPSDFVGQIPDCSLVQMEPPRRKACARIARRMMVLSDGRFVSCEQDFLGTQALGRVGENSIREIWTGAMAGMRCNHARGQWNEHALCRACRDWHRP
jgi:hypothetical protein